MRIGFTIFFTALSFTLAGCVDLKPKPGKLDCAEHSDCPSGWYCGTDWHCYPADADGGPEECDSRPSDNDTTVDTAETETESESTLPPTTDTATSEVNETDSDTREEITGDSGVDGSIS